MQMAPVDGCKPAKDRLCGSSPPKSAPCTLLEKIRTGRSCRPPGLGRDVRRHRRSNERILTYSFASRRHIRLKCESSEHTTCSLDRDDRSRHRLPARISPSPPARNRDSRPYDDVSRERERERDRRRWDDNVRRERPGSRWGRE